MKTPLLLILSTCLLTGCANAALQAEAREREMARQDHLYCLDYGTVAGTPAYRTCRENRATVHTGNYSSNYDPYYDSYDDYDNYSPASGYPAYPRRYHDDYYR